MSVTAGSGSSALVWPTDLCSLHYHEDLGVRHGFNGLSLGKLVSGRKGWLVGLLVSGQNTSWT